MNLDNTAQGHEHNAVVMQSVGFSASCWRRGHRNAQTTTDRRGASETRGPALLSTWLTHRIEGAGFDARSLRVGASCWPCRLSLGRISCVLWHSPRPSLSSNYTACRPYWESPVTLFLRDWLTRTDPRDVVVKRIRGIRPGGSGAARHAKTTTRSTTWHLRSSTASGRHSLVLSYS